MNAHTRVLWNKTMKGARSRLEINEWKRNLEERILSHLIHQINLQNKATREEEEKTHGTASLSLIPMNDASVHTQEIVNQMRCKPKPHQTRVQCVGTAATNEHDRNKKYGWNIFAKEKSI